VRLRKAMSTYTQLANVAPACDSSTRTCIRDADVERETHTDDPEYHAQRASRFIGHGDAHPRRGDIGSFISVFFVNMSDRISTAGGATRCCCLRFHSQLHLYTLRCLREDKRTFSHAHGFPFPFSIFPFPFFHSDLVYVNLTTHTKQDRSYDDG